ncbi:MAG: potassium/proton antiporter [Parvibaculum sp.]|uniref:potassium/proton antiporter n=1 Tax=Parvibaculum sp. TaxID=2024848 RepID=UPI002842F272|nr:potassium/proton antiporter [Parvibaculum sp.]MDR3498191.1 potassium/proton antiporter [Parvibaculum sp.]
MEFANQIILIAAALITFSIFAGVLSSRIGAPLLLVFLAFGMLAGEDGIGGIVFQDFRLAYLMGSVALALILFDGGLRTKREDFSLALVPAVLLATLGVAVTAAITGVAAHYMLGYNWLEALLLGAIVGPTDAAAVFLLLHLRGLRLRPRVGSTLEVESGLNDPMSIFLTLALVGLISKGWPKGGAGEVALGLAWDFIWQMGGGLIFGLVGGQIVLRAINRLKFSGGIYPILAGALALVVFAGAQKVEASGFLAVYLVGTTLGNNPHRAATEISRFSDGLAWLAQIVMFLMMGLLVTPSKLVPILLPSLAIAAALILVARPVAVWLSLAFLKFDRREISFISWVGLRGAVPIFLATIPILDHVRHAHTIFGVAYVVVLASLLVQGWTISLAAKITDVELPPRPSPRARVEFDLPAGKNRTVVAYTVDPMSIVARRRMARMPFPAGTEIISVMREGQALNAQPSDGLKAGDVVMLMSRTDDLPSLDRLFAARKARAQAKGPGTYDFTLDPDANAGEVADMYGFLVTPHERDHTLASLMHARLGREIERGSRISTGAVQLVALSVDDDGSPQKIGLDLDPPPPQSTRTLIRLRVNEALRSVRELFLADPRN